MQASELRIFTGLPLQAAVGSARSIVEDRLKSKALHEEGIAKPVKPTPHLSAAPRAVVGIGTYLVRCTEPIEVRSTLHASMATLVGLVLPSARNRSPGLQVVAGGSQGRSLPPSG